MKHLQSPPDGLPRTSQYVLRRLRGVSCCLLLAMTCLCISSSVHAEDESGQLSFPDVAPNYVDTSMIPSKEDQVSEARGIDGRVGFIGLPAFGRDASIAPIELFPYLQSNNKILFGDLRGFIDTNGRVGGNAGVGFRFIEPNDLALFGVNAFYDADNSTSQTFQQMSIGWEARMEQAGFFGNVYFPVGQTEKLISQRVYNERFDAHQILFDLQNRIGKSMHGLDVNFQAYLPGEFLQEHQVQAFAGWYHFQGGTGTNDINGFKVQLQGKIVPAIETQMALTNDNYYGTNFNIGVSWRFGTRDLPSTSLRGQLRRFVERNYNVIVTQRTEVHSGMEAINPNTGLAYVVQHVGTNAGTGSGTTSDPYASVSDAQTAGADVIFVQGGSVINEDIVLSNGQYLFGEGTAHQLRDSRYGLFNVPGAIGSTTTPQISGSPGNAVTLADNSMISGFNIFNPTGHGIVADGIENFKIEHVVIEDAGDDAVYINQTTGGSLSDVTVSGGAANGLTIMDIDDVLNLNNIYIEDVAGDGVHIDGGLGTIAFSDQLIIQNVGQAAFSIENMERLTEVDDQGTTSTLDDVTTITPSVVSVEQLVVRGASGGTGISALNNTGLIGFGEVDIQTEDAAGIYVRDTTAFIVGNGFLQSTNGPVADIEDSTISISLTSLIADGGTYGARFVDSTGSFLVYGTGTSLGSGGSISNTDVGIYMENADTVGMQTVDFTDNAKLAEVHGGNIFSITGSNITGTTDMLIDATNLTQLQIFQSAFTNNLLSSSTGILFQSDTVGSYTASVSNNLSTDTTGTFFKAQTLAGGETSSLTYAFQNNQIELDSVGGVAAAMDWTGPVLAYVTNNTIVGTQSGQTAIQMATGDATTVGQFNINQNQILLGGTNSIGVDLQNESPVNVIIDANQINLNGLNGVGIRASLAKASALSIGDNEIKDNAGGATGILLTSVENQSQIAIDNNSIDLSLFSTFVDRGIVLSTVTASDGATDPVVTFFSSANNTVNGATTLFSYPATGVDGWLRLNGSVITLP